MRGGGDRWHGNTSLTNFGYLMNFDYLMNLSWMTSVYGIRKEEAGARQFDVWD